jgi:tetratricopeptide (TPR) repeat protein
VSNPFVFDDQVSILDNPQIDDLTSLSVLLPERELPVAGRPVANVTLAVNYALGGFDVTSYHVFNIAVHILCALLLFGCVRRALDLPWRPAWLAGASLHVAFAVALLWLLHPLNSEVVNYLTQRTESLMALFYLLTLYASLHALRARGPAKWTILAVVSCALGMGSKEAMATAPIIVVLFDRVFAFESFGAAWRARRWLYLGLAGTWLVLAAILSTDPRPFSAGFSTDVDSWTYLLNQPALITRYLALVLWPRSLVANYGWAVTPSIGDVAPHAIVVLALLALTIAALRWRPRLGFLGAWFFVTLAPASSVIPVATEVGAERRMYLPTAALIVLAVVGAMWLWHRFGPKTTFAWVAAALVLGVLSTGLAAATLARNREYRSGLVLAEVTLQRYPSSSAHHVLAEYLLEAGRRDEAIVHLRAALPGAPRAHYTLGVELFKEGKTAEAILEFHAFVRRQPRLAHVLEARGYLGKAFAAQQDWAAAIGEFREILTLSPDNALADYALADMLSATERFDDAIPHYRKYLRDQPRDVAALNHLGLALGSAGQLDEALQVFRQADAVEPNDGEVQLNLAGALWARQEYGEALAYAERAVALLPDNPNARELRQDILRRLER